MNLHSLTKEVPHASEVYLLTYCSPSAVFPVIYQVTYIPKFAPVGSSLFGTQRQGTEDTVGSLLTIPCIVSDRGYG